MGQLSRTRDALRGTTNSQRFTTRPTGSKEDMVKAAGGATASSTEPMVKASAEPTNLANARSDESQQGHSQASMNGASDGSGSGSGSWSQACVQLENLGSRIGRIEELVLRRLPPELPGQA